MKYFSPLKGEMSQGDRGVTGFPSALGKIQLSLLPPTADAATSLTREAHFSASFRTIAFGSLVRELSRSD